VGVFYHCPNIHHAELFIGKRVVPDTGWRACGSSDACLNCAEAEKQLYLGKNKAIVRYYESLNKTNTDANMDVITFLWIGGDYIVSRYALYNPISH